MNYYLIIIIASLIAFIVWMYFATKNAPEINEEDKVVNLTFNINTETVPEKPKRGRKPKRVKADVVKRPVGRPRKTVE